MDERARAFVIEDAEDYGAVSIIAHEPDEPDEALTEEERIAEYRRKASDERRDSGIPARAPVIFLEVTPGDSSEFEEDLVVRGIVRCGFRVLQVTSGNVPNTIAAVLLAVRDLTGVKPGVYFEWTEGSPVGNLLRFLVTGTGEVAPVTREVLRRAEPVRSRRPDVHVS
jgi:hypothetical protein